MLLPTQPRCDVGEAQSTPVTEEETGADSLSDSPTWHSNVHLRCLWEHVNFEGHQKLRGENLLFFILFIETLIFFYVVEIIKHRKGK